MLDRHDSLHYRRYPKCNSFECKQIFFLCQQNLLPLPTKYHIFTPAPHSTLLYLTLLLKIILKRLYLTLNCCHLCHQCQAFRLIRLEEINRNTLKGALSTIFSGNKNSTYLSDISIFKIIILTTHEILV